MVEPMPQISQIPTSGLRFFVLTLTLALGFIAAGCVPATGPDEAESGSAGVQRWSSFRGMCDASAVEMLSADLFVVANDEDNFLRMYSRNKEGLPTWRLDLTRFLRIEPKSPEADFEGAARIGNLIYWITSHGANKDGKERPNRRRFFATKIREDEGAILLEPFGKPYRALVDDLAQHTQLSGLDILQAAQAAPKSEGALNIEGLAPAPEGSLLIGFRNPILRGKAVVVPLLNPADVVTGQPARLGDPKFLDLGGLGIRSLTPHKDGFLVVAGSYNGDGKSKLYEWDGTDTPPRLLTPRGLQGNPEAMAAIPGTSASAFWVVSDDGGREIQGVDCKDLKDSQLRTFRAFILNLDD